MVREAPKAQVLQGRERTVEKPGPAMILQSVGRMDGMYSFHQSDPVHSNGSKLAIPLADVYRSSFMLNGGQVKMVSSEALDHWDHLLLVEDDTARALRRGKPGVADSSTDVMIRLHRVGRSGLKIADERTQPAGQSTGADKSTAALEMLDGRTVRGAVVIAGAAYGCSRQFLAGIAARSLDAVVEIRPSSLMSSP